MLNNEFLKGPMHEFRVLSTKKFLAVCKCVKHISKFIVTISYIEVIAIGMNLQFACKHTVFVPNVNQGNEPC